MFGGDFLTDINFPTTQADYSASQEDIIGPSAIRGDAEPGILPLTVSLCKHLHLQNQCFMRGKTDAYEGEYLFAEFVGRIKDLTICQEDSWEFIIDDGTGEIPVIYQLRMDLGPLYEEALTKIRPPDENDLNKRQQPVRIIGTPQFFSGQLVIQGAFLKPCTYSEMFATHPLHVALGFLTWLNRQGEGVRRPSVGGDAPAASQPAKDPFGDEPIVIPDADVSDIIGADRLRRVVWKLLRQKHDEGTAHVFKEYVFKACRKWTQKEVLEAIADLEEGGVLIYIGGEQIALV